MILDASSEMLSRYLTALPSFLYSFAQPRGGAKVERFMVLLLRSTPAPL
jgi:hypothetical protein